MTVERKSVDVGRLKTLAEKANREHSQAERAAGQAVKHAVEAGGLLLKAKEEVGHGNFIRWIEESFEGSERVARKYMRLATAVEQNRIDPAAHSSLTGIERFLREQDVDPTPNTPSHGLTDEEYEPEVPGEEYGMRGPRQDEGNEPAPQGSPRSPVRKRDLQTSAFSAMHRFIHENKGEEKDRIQAIKEQLDIEEESLLASPSAES